MGGSLAESKREVSGRVLGREIKRSKWSGGLVMEKKKLVVGCMGDGKGEVGGRVHG